MTEHKWLGVPAVDGARVGALRLVLSKHLSSFATRSAKVDMHSGSGVSATAVDWCPLSEVDTRTREWLRSLAELLPEWQAMRELCEAFSLYQEGNIDSYHVARAALAKYRELVKP